MLKIGFDYTAAVWQGAGIGRYTRELARAAIEQGEEEFILFYPAYGLPSASPYLAHVRQLCKTHPSVRTVPIPLSPRILTILWQRLRVPFPVEYLIGRVDLLHSPDFVLPPTTRRTRTILTIHDLAFLTHPECFEPSLRQYLLQAVPRSIQRADRLCVDSFATQQALDALLGIPPQRSVVIYPGVASRFAPLPKAQCEVWRQRLALPPAFLLFVGTLEPRKNLVRLLQAFHLLTQERPWEHLSLVLVGKKGWLYEDIFATRHQLGLTERVRLLDFVDDEILPTLYNLAEAFVYPSLAEGFGLPVAEALACGTPVVTTNQSSLPEVAGDAAILVDPHQPEAIAEGIVRALAQAERLRTAGPVQARQFSWEHAAQQILRCYREVGNWVSV